MSIEPSVIPSATVAIVTRYRREELRRALNSAVAQTAACELVVVDDGSDDDTAEMVTAEFPDARLHRSEQSRGIPVQRNQAVRMAGAPIVFFLDDDAIFSSKNIVAQTLPAFDEHDVAAVSIPYLDLIDERLLWRVRPAPPGPPQAVRSFVGCSHAVRRSVFLEMGGYRESMTTYGEESELSLRLLDRAFVVLLGSSDPVHHFRSSIGRSKPRECRARTRNTILTALLFVPARALPGHLFLTLAYVPLRHPSRPEPTRLCRRDRRWLPRRLALARRAQPGEYRLLPARRAAA
jgi:GT2 family glycosyltransferase